MPTQSRRRRRRRWWRPQTRPRRRSLHLTASSGVEEWSSAAEVAGWAAGFVADVGWWWWWKASDRRVTWEAEAATGSRTDLDPWGEAWAGRGRIQTCAAVEVEVVRWEWTWVRRHRRLLRPCTWEDLRHTCTGTARLLRPPHQGTRPSEGGPHTREDGAWCRPARLASSTPEATTTDRPLLCPTRLQAGASAGRGPLVAGSFNAAKICSVNGHRSDSFLSEQTRRSFYCNEHATFYFISFIYVTSFWGKSRKTFKSTHSEEEKDTTYVLKLI